MGVLNNVFVTDLPSLRAVSQSVAQAAVVFGIRSTGDGGGGNYWLNMADTTSSDNGSTIVVASDGGRWYLQNLAAISAKQIGAYGDDASDDSACFSTTLVPALYVTSSAAPYLIASNTTVSADLWFFGGVLHVPENVTLTINGDIFAPSKVIFKGAGTVIVNKGIIDVAWFDGADASAKTAFCLRGVSNTNGTGKVLEFKPPAPTDTWAVQSPNNQWGYGWGTAAPIDIEQAQAYTMYLTYSSFIATAPMQSVWRLGAGASKADGQNFPLRLKIDGGNGLAKFAVQSYGSSHLYLPYVEAYYSGGVALTPNGSKQCSDIQLGFLDTGELYNQAVLMDGSNGTNNTVTDIEVGFVSSTGFANGNAADSVVRVGSNTNGITVRKTAHRAVAANYQDATEAVVLVTNNGTMGATDVSPRYGINIGPVTNGSTTQTAECVVVADGTNGVAALISGVTVAAGSENDTSSPPGGATISLNYTSGAIVQGLPSSSATNQSQHVTVNSSCVGTVIDGVTPSQVTDAGQGTLINGRNLGPFAAAAVGISPVSYTNPYAYAVKYQLQGGTVTQANLKRGPNTVTLFSGASLTAGEFDLLPGDTLQYYYASGSAPSAAIIPE